LREANYNRNLLNQYTNRTVPSAIDVIGLATLNASLSVNGSTAYRRGEYFWRELPVSNASGPVLTDVSVIATAGASSTTNTGTALTPPATQSFGYDADGNLTNDLIWQYTWDAENRLKEIQNLSTIAGAKRRRVVWEYDAMGRRIRQSTYLGWSGSTWTNVADLKLLYDGWHCIAELNATNNAHLRGYAWGLDLSGTPSGAGGVGGMLWMRPAGGSAHFAAFDGNGNVAGLVDGASGAVSARYEYDPFGNIIRITGTIARDNPFRFSTQRTDDTTDLVLYEYRAYSPSLGRWPNRDPIGEAGEALLSSAKDSDWKSAK
jgi:RHS repeat-associated protein